MVLVSVVVPALNDQDTIEKMLTSLQNQSLQDFEVIVVDDGKDRTADITRDFGYTVIERDKRGIASALNEGIREANGRYIARQDADDTSEPNRLETQVNYLDERQDVGIVGTGAFLWDGSKRRGRRHVLEAVEHADLLEKNHVIHGSVMMRKDILEEVGGYDEDLDYIEDLDLWVRMARETKVRNIDKPLYNFTIHGESIYAERLRKVKLLEQYVRTRERTGVPDDVEQHVRDGDPSAVVEHLSSGQLAQMHREIAKEYLRYGRPQAGRKQVMNAISRSPSLMDVPLLTLSLFPGQVAKSVANAYRYVLNYRIQKINQRR
jgi:glycosyltransferase involved in cell wall biosynthesis